MNLFRRNKNTMIPQLEEPEDKFFESIEEYKAKESQDVEDNEFPLPKMEDMHLKINEKNDLSPIDKKYLLDIFDILNSYRKGEIERFDNLLTTVKEIFENISGSYYDLFEFCSKMAKKLEVTKDQIEKCYSVLLEKKNATTLDLDNETLSAIGRMVCYSYDKIDQYKIKDMRKLEEAINKVLKDKINIYDNFVNWCAKEKKDPKKEKMTEYYKKNRKDYDCLPEVIFMVNHFSKITTINLELDKIYNAELKEDEYKFLELGILNIHWILNSLENVKFNLICKQLQSLLFKRYKEKLVEGCNKINDLIKPKDIIYKDAIFFRKKWNFTDQLKLSKLSVFDEETDVIKSKTLELKEKKAIFSAKTFGNAFKKIATIGENLINLGKEKNKNSTRIDIVQQHQNLFEFIMICIFSLNEAKKDLNVELVMNDTYTGEFILLLNEIYKFDWIKKDDTNEFHIFDLLLFNKVIKKMTQLNLEFNCLDYVTFNKVLSLLYFNQSITKLNLSLFSSDLMYIPEFLYKLFSEIYLEKSAEQIKRNFDEETYLFCDLKDMEDKILDKLFTNFSDLLSTFFEIINNRKTIKELGFNIDAPRNVINKSKYMNAIYKFILNLLFYVNKNNITKFCLLSPGTEFNSHTKPEINELVKSINPNQRNNLEELTLQFKFYDFASVNSFVTTKLRVLNIGNLDFNTFKYFCDLICSYKFNINSNLEELSVSLSNNITEFSDDVKILFKKLFRIKIKELTSLTLLTNLDLSDNKQYDDLLKLLNYNWISSYVIIFAQCENDEYNPDENMNKLQYLVPSSLGKKLLEKKTLSKIEDNKDKIDDAYWCLKYILNIKHAEDKRYKEINQKMIFDILKYVYITKNPKLSHYYAIHKK